LYVIVPKGFFPVQDTGIIQGITEASEKISFPAMAEKQQHLADAILKDPAVESISSFIGVDGINTTLNSGRIQINLKPLAERGLDASEVIRRLRPNLKSVDGIQFFMQPVQDLTVEDRVTRTQFQYTLSDPDQNELNHWTEKFIAKLQGIAEIRDVATDQQLDGQAATLVIDRDTASRMGISAQTIDETLYDAFGQRQISTLYTQLNQYHVILETLPDFQKNPSRLNSIFVRSTLAPSALAAAIEPHQAAGVSGITLTSASTGSSNPTPTTAINGGAVPLSVFTHFESRTAPLAINHQGQFPVVTVSFNLAKGASLGAATDAIEKVRSDLAMPLSIQAEFQGAAASFKASLQNEPLLILAALVTVYIVLGVLYESFIHPITILSTLPSAGIGACLALLLTGTELNVVSIIGIVLLIGIVKKNGIMMIDFALDAERKEGKSAVEAITQACLLRFRPIMMTTMAALLAGIPLAVGSGIGSELRHPLGISMVGGLLLSQVLTLYTTPVIYIFFDRIGKRFAHA
jgi:multidrug efflux pump